MNLLFYNFLFLLEHNIVSKGQSNSVTIFLLETRISLCGWAVLRKKHRFISGAVLLKIKIRLYITEKVIFGLQKGGMGVIIYNR